MPYPSQPAGPRHGPRCCEPFAATRTIPRPSRPVSSWTKPDRQNDSRSKVDHLFATYRWVFELDAEAPQRTCIRSATWAHFPGLHGKIYRALVIGTGAHRVVVRLTLKRIASRALAGRTQIGEDAADYVDVFEVPIRSADSRTAEQALRDAVRARSRAPGGAVVLWIHRHVLGFRLGPVSSPEHVYRLVDHAFRRRSRSCWRPTGRSCTASWTCDGRTAGARF